MTRAEVKDALAGVAHEVLDGGNVTLCEVNDVDIVAHAGAVGRGIVVAEYVQMVALADGSLRDVRHEVVGDAVRMLADFAACVRADGVKVAQVHNRPCGISLCDVTQNLLAHVFCPAVGIGAVAGLGVLAQWHLVVAGVDRGRRGEDDALGIVFGHDLAERQRGVKIILVVGQRLCNRLAHGLETGKVDGTGNFMLGKNLFQ